MFKIGLGYDIHRLVEDRDLIIGGVKIPYEKGLLGHSDAPKMMPYIPEMKTTLAKAMNIDIESISIKAKTKEILDSVGEKLAIETNAVVLLEK